LKVAVTVVAVLTVTVHAPVPGQALLQLAKTEPAAGAAVRVTAVPGVTDCEHVAPQLMPAGLLLVTVPVPVPFFVTVKVTGVAVKVAVTEAAAVTAHVPVPEHAPLQPAKVEPAAGAAVRVTAVPGVKDCAQLAPQLIPAGVLITVPVPVPLLVTDSVQVVPPVADPLTAREMLSPLAVKFTFPAKVPAAVGANRTVTVRLAPGASE
jgi:hypothetical protein